MRRTYQVLIILGVLLVWIAWVVGLNRRPELWPYAQYFESLTALFSGLAFGAFVIALYLQKAELELQRLELRLTRDQLARQREEMQTQNETLRLQRLENTFFQMLNQHHGLVEGIELEDQFGDAGPGAVRIERAVGRAAFLLAQRRLIASIKKAPDVLSGWNEFYGKFGYSISHYLRNLRGIFEFIETTDTAQRNFFLRLVCSQLSNAETGLLFYLGFKSGDWKELAERAGLFRYLSDSVIADMNHRGFYHASAYIPPPLD